MNWEDLRVFLAIARAGTLSGAARLLNIDQATVSRRLATLEAQLNVRLIERLPREARLTAIGQKILQAARDVESSTFKIERMSVISRRERTRLTISAPPVLARHFFAPNMLALTQQLPRVQLSILSDAHFVSLSRLEADLAVRLSPGVKDSDIIKKIGRMEFALYAGREYRHIEEPDKWGFIAYPERQTDFDHKRWLYETVGKRHVVCEMTDLSHQYEAACSGVGVAGLPCFIADCDARLIKLETSQPMLNLGIWIAKHPDRRNDELVAEASNMITNLLINHGLSSPTHVPSTLPGNLKRCK
ncbi:LysR family transcriptional regulator [Acerihabitans sp. TG2]|uniref:LysR family transcriptional regulator n=1 Tax=Acerihabitans sp. TG2 TaxID=3096008 RepID=UPI002B23314B|nr:LysR family transcriptional regulator [Acerihabitans sp. TG2]MEA9393519.1 LysR family transcriptional regulator [Acerihabitans sp. TG2]